MDSSIRLLFNKETSGSLQSDAADRPTDLQLDNTHTDTAETAPLVDYITVILTMACTQSFCWIWLHVGVCVCVGIFLFVFSCFSEILNGHCICGHFNLFLRVLVGN